MCVGVKLIELEFSRTRPKYVKAFSSLDHWIERSGVHVRYCEKIIMRDTKAWFTEFQSPALQFIIRSCSRANFCTQWAHFYILFTLFQIICLHKKKKNRKELKKKAGNRKQEILFCLHSKKDLLPNLRATSNHKCSFQHQAIMALSTLNALCQTFTGIVCS